MVRALFIFLVFAISLQAISNSEILKRADSFMVSGSHSNYFRAYNDYKNIYLLSIVDNDEELKQKALKGIIKSGNILKIDVSKYEKEFEENYLKKSNTPVQTNSYTPPEPKPMKESKNIQSVHVDPMCKLQDVKWDEDKLVLIFDKPLKEEQIKYFTLHDKDNKIFRYVFDIQTSMLLKAHNLTKADIDRVRLSQFDPKTLRLVFDSKKKIEISHAIDEHVLSINLGSKESVKVAAKAAEPLKKDKNKIVVIDPGHGGDDPGAIGYNKIREKDIVLDISKELESILKSRGYRVYMTRKNDKFIKLKDRTKFANDKNANIFISVHANAVDRKNADNIQGIECFFLSPSRSERAKNAAAAENAADISDMNMYGKDSYLNLLNHHNILASNKLAIDLQRGMLGEINKKYKGVNDSGVKEGPFWVLVGAQMPSVLVEVGFISHPDEAKRLASDLYRKTLAIGLADGIERYFLHN